MAALPYIVALTALLTVLYNIGVIGNKKKQDEDE